MWNTTDFYNLVCRIFSFLQRWGRIRNWLSQEFDVFHHFALLPSILVSSFGCSLSLCPAREIEFKAPLLRYHQSVGEHLWKQGPVHQWVSHTSGWPAATPVQLQCREVRVGPAAWVASLCSSLALEVLPQHMEWERLRPGAQPAIPQVPLDIMANNHWVITT